MLWTSCRPLRRRPCMQARSHSCFSSRKPELVAEDAAPPAAIMIELAPEPEAEVPLTRSRTFPTWSMPRRSRPPRMSLLRCRSRRPPPDEPVPQPRAGAAGGRGSGSRFQNRWSNRRRFLPSLLPELVEAVDPIEQLVMAQLENVAVPIPVDAAASAEAGRGKAQRKTAGEEEGVEKPKAPAAPASKAALQGQGRSQAQSNRTAATADDQHRQRAAMCRPAKWRDRACGPISRAAPSVTLSRTIAQTSMVRVA